MGRPVVCCWWRPSGRLVWIGCCRRNSAAWRKPFAVHDPGKIICDLAIGLALGGDCLADVTALRDEPGIYGRVASDPTVSRLIKLLASDADRAIAAIGRARKTARETDWRLTGDGSPVGSGHGGRSVDHRFRCDLGDGAIGEGEGCGDVQTQVSGSTGCARSSITARKGPGNR